MSREEEMWKDAVGYSLDTFLTDYPDDMEPCDILELFLHGCGDDRVSWDDTIISLDENGERLIMIASEYAYESPYDLGKMIESTARSYVTFAEKWSAQ